MAEKMGVLGYYLVMDVSNYAFVAMILAMILMCCFIAFLITKIKIQSRKLLECNAKEEKSHMFLDMTDVVIFEYNIQSDIMYHSDKYKEFFGRNPVIYNYSEAFVEMPYIHPDDRQVFREFCNSLHIGKSNFSYELRIKNKVNQYEWCHINGSSYSKKKKLPDYVIGRIVNIDAQKKQLDKLQFKAQRDQMTNVFNKSTTMEKINETIKRGKKYERHALFVIDIDDFKHVNDTYGHLQGDYVLTTIVSKLVNKFREEDIVGRIGGDEFVALMKNVSGREQIVRKAETICKEFNREFKYNDEVMRVSCSIGVTVYPMDGKDYEELVQHADKALYEVKADGKNSYMMYCDLEENK